MIIRPVMRAMLVAGIVALAACQSVEIAPEPIIPKPLVAKLPVTVGVVFTPEQRNLRHAETRSGVDWAVSLGLGNQRVAGEVFTALFDKYVLLESLEGARGVAGLAAIFEPRMEQYSFATANETGGDYYAVTIRYRINVYAPDLQLVDSYTLTGYGNNRDQVMSTSKPLDAASRAAMRDAAAKLLVQFPEQPLGLKLAKGEILVAPETAVAATGGAVPGGSSPIEAVSVVVPQPAAAPPEESKLL